MRVGLLSYNALAGDAVGNQLAALADGLADHGADLRLFVQSADRLHPRLRPFAHVIDRVEPHGPAWEYLSGADLVLATYAQFYPLLDFLPLLAGGKPRVLLHYHGVTPPELWLCPNHRETLELGLRRRGLVWSADHAVATSAFTRRDLLAATDFPEPHVTTLPLLVDGDRFRPDPACRFLHDRLGLPADARVLLYVGRLASNKRTPLLADAVARLRDLGPEVHAVLVGDDDDIYEQEAERCRAQARELGVMNRLHVVGKVSDDELPLAYRSADVLVLPSLHEGFCLPVIEAMASGLPVVASRSAALPETVADAGLTFAPDDSADLARQLRRVLAPTQSTPHGDRPRRVAFVAFRFGPDVIGGAESSLRTMAKALQSAGHHIEVFTTCTRAESRWTNELPAGSVSLDGLPTHRYPIDSHDPAAHDLAIQAVNAAGRATPADEARYLETSVHSSALLTALQARQAEFDAIIVGPYLHGLTADVARALPAKTVVVPCFHDEPFARLPGWPTLYGEVGGLLFHSPEEQEFAQSRLGVNHPNAHEVGALIEPPAADAADVPGLPKEPYIVYCGRYSKQKKVHVLADWAARYGEDRAFEFHVVFMGTGEVEIPDRPWVHNLGRVTEAQKRTVLAGARALVLLSEQESLSLAVLEAWSHGTPVRVARGCAVLAGQVARSGGGALVDDYDSFLALMDDLGRRPAVWRERGEDGRRYVAERYGSREKYVAGLVETIDRLRLPLAEQMRERGRRRAAAFDRPAWWAALGRLLETVLEGPARPFRDDLGVKPIRSECRVSWGTPTALVPVRLFNWGSHAAVADGPGRTEVYCEVSELTTGRVVGPATSSPLPGLLVPGRSLTAALPVPLPDRPGQYRIAIWTARPLSPPTTPPYRVHLALSVETRDVAGAGPTATALLVAVHDALPEMHRLHRLPDDYVDVTTGRFQTLKHALKQKILNNFKRAYVDVLSRQQTEMNYNVLAAIGQLTESCALLDATLRTMQHRVDQIEVRLRRLESAAPEPAAVAPGEAV